VGLGGSPQEDGRKLEKAETCGKESHLSDTSIFDSTMNFQNSSAVVMI